MSIDIKEKIISDRDIKVVCNFNSQRLVADIKKGQPFYAYDINEPWNGKKTIMVPAFGAQTNAFPIEWFTQYFDSTEREKAYKAWIECNNQNINHKESFIAGFIAGISNQ